MLKRLRKWFLSNLLYIFISSQLVNSASVQFYQFKNYSGLLFNSSSTASCVNVPAKKGNEFVYSIKTDICIMVYAYPNCQSWSKKFDHDNSPEWQWHVKSYHICNEDVGGYKLNIDITKFYDLFNTPSDTPKIIQSYHNVCECINIPENIQEMPTWSINNHGNNLLAYYESDCSKELWEPKFIPAGHLSETMYMSNHQMIDNATNTVYKILSLGPDPNSTYFKISCEDSYSYDWIMPLEFLETDQDRVAMQQLYSQNGNDRTTQNNKHRIAFFTNTEFQGARYESAFNESCKSRLQTEVLSVETDVCVILYTDNKCKSRSIKVYPGGSANLTQNWEFTVTGELTLNRLYYMFPNWKWIIGSFHACSEEEGSSKQLTVDLTSYYPADKINQSTPIIYRRYLNLCTCRNIPNDIRILDKFSIENHGNALMAYFEYDCKDTLFDPMWIPAGRSSYSIAFSSFKQMDNKNRTVVQKIQSIGPDQNAAYFQNSCSNYANMLKDFVTGMSTQINHTQVSSQNTRKTGNNTQMYPQVSIYNILNSSQALQSHTFVKQPVRNKNEPRVLRHQSIKDNNIMVQSANDDNQLRVKMSVEDNQGFKYSSKTSSKMPMQSLGMEADMDGHMSPDPDSSQLSMEPSNTGNQMKKRSLRTDGVPNNQNNGNQMLTPSGNGIRIVIQPPNQGQPSVLGNPMMAQPNTGNQMMMQPTNNAHQMYGQSPNGELIYMPPMVENAPPEVAQKEPMQALSKDGGTIGNAPTTETPPIKENAPPEIDIDSPTNEGITHTHNQLLGQQSQNGNQMTLQDKQEIMNPENNNQILAQPSQYGNQGQPNNNQMLTQPNNNQFPVQPNNGNQMLTQSKTPKININMSSQPSNMGIQMSVQPRQMGNQMQMQPPTMGNQMPMQPYSTGNQMPGQPMNNGNQMSEQPMNNANQMSEQPMNNANQMPGQFLNQPVTETSPMKENVPPEIDIDSPTNEGITHTHNQLLTQQSQNGNQMNLQNKQEIMNPTNNNQMLAQPSNYGNQAQSQPNGNQVMTQPNNGNQMLTQSPKLNITMYSQPSNTGIQMSVQPPQTGNQMPIQNGNQLLARTTLQNKQTIMNPPNNNNQMLAQPLQYGNQIPQQSIPNNNQAPGKVGNQMLIQVNNNGNQNTQPNVNGNQMFMQSPSGNIPITMQVNSANNQLPVKSSVINVNMSSQPSNLGAQVSGQPSNIGMQLYRQPPNTGNRMPMQPSNTLNQMPAAQPSNTENQMNHQPSKHWNIMTTLPPSQGSQFEMKPMDLNPILLKSANVDVNVTSKPNSTDIQMSVQPTNTSDQNLSRPPSSGKQWPIKASSISNQITVQPSGEASLLMPVQAFSNKNNDDQMVVQVTIKDDKGSNGSKTLGQSRHIYHAQPKQHFKLTEKIRMQSAKMGNSSKMQPSNVNQISTQASNISVNMSSQPSNQPSIQVSIQPNGMGNQKPMQPMNMGNQMPMQQNNMGNQMPIQQNSMGNRMPMQQNSMGNQMPMQQNNMGNQMPMQQNNMGNQMPMQQNNMGNQMPMQQSNINQISTQSGNIRVNMSSQPSNPGIQVSVQPSNMGNQVPMQQSNMANQMPMQSSETRPINENAPPEVLQKENMQPMTKGGRKNGNGPTTKTPPIKENAPPEIDIDSPTNEEITHTHNQLLTQQSQNGIQMSLQNKQEIMNPTNNNQLAGQPSQNGNRMMSQPYNGNQVMAQPNNGNQMRPQSQAQNVGISLYSQPSNTGIQMSIQPQQNSNQMPMQSSNMGNQIPMQSSDNRPINENAPPEVIQKGNTQQLTKSGKKNGNGPSTETPPIKENAPPEIDIDSPTNEGITHTHNQLISQPSQNGNQMSLQDKQEIMNPENNNPVLAQPSQYGNQGQPNNNQMLTQPYNNQFQSQPNNNQFPAQPNNGNQMLSQSQTPNVGINVYSQPSNMGIQMSMQPSQMGNQMQNQNPYYLQQSSLQNKQAIMNPTNNNNQQPMQNG